ncbi:MAG TPA: YgeY family selenium metabolism-linked hydrolase, partial [Candidatus Syntrophosphaera sp.]|nr:YgeY family selenium metabolism-linked hydrolase [Candidatus Syntrophosphaera sp.]
MYDKIMERARAYESESVRYLTDMIRIPAFSTKEKELVEYLLKEMQTAGFDEAYIDPLGNVLGRIGNGPRVIAFDAHIDTVY